MPYDQSAGKKPITGWARRSQRRRHVDDEHERQKHPPPHYACDPNLSSLLAQADRLHPKPLEMTRSGATRCPTGSVPRGSPNRRGAERRGRGSAIWARGPAKPSRPTSPQQAANPRRIPVVSASGFLELSRAWDTTSASTALARHRCRPVRRSRPQLGVPVCPPRRIVPHAYRRKARKTGLSWRRRESNPRPQSHRAELLQV